MLETPEQRRGLYEKKQQQYRKSSKKQQYGPGTFNKLPVIFRSKITESLMFQRDIHCLFYNLHGQEKSQDTIACLKKQDRKSTRLNSSHVSISYAVFCLKKKN